MAEPLEQEDKRPDPPVVAVLVPVVITMTAAQAAEYASWYEIESETHSPAGEPYEPGDDRAVTDLQERGISEAVLEALTQDSTGDELWNLVTVTVLGEGIVPVGESFPGCEDGYVTGLCGHRVARSEWSAGYRACEHCGTGMAS